MPAHDEHGIKSPAPQPRRDLRRVASGEMVEPRSRRDVSEEMVLVARHEVDVPVEADAEPGLGLVPLACTMREEDGHVDPARQLAEERRLVLDRMRCHYREAHDEAR
jgi:hypothetical protein